MPYALWEMATLPKPRELQRMTALAQLEVEELQLAVAQERAEIDAASPDIPEATRRFLEVVQEVLNRLQATLDVPVGVTVEQVAERLTVTAPTVRKWLDEGLLQRVEGRKPVEIAQRSVVVTERALARVREHYPPQQWSKALAAYLHDQDLQDQDWFAEGIAALKRGDLVER